MTLNIPLFLEIYREIPYLGYKDSQRIGELCEIFSLEEPFTRTVSSFVSDKTKVADLCCGKPSKIREIARSNLRCQFVGFDVNPRMAKFYRGENLSFVRADVNLLLDIKTEGMLAVHACGSLSDRVVELSVALNLPVLVVPCCYGKLNGSPPTPLSETFSSGELLGIYHTLNRIAKRSEGSNWCKGMGTLIRTLFNYDRLARLEESGKKARLLRLTDMHRPHNLAIIGE